MEMTMTNNFGFCELNENEMMAVDGGTIWSAIGAGAIKVGTVVGGAVGVGATGGLIIVGAAAVAIVGGIALGCYVNSKT